MRGCVGKEGERKGETKRELRWPRAEGARSGAIKMRHLPMAGGAWGLWMRGKKWERDAESDRAEQSGSALGRSKRAEPVWGMSESQ